MNRLDISDDSMCFACGKKNPHGLKLEFSDEDGRVTTSIAFDKRYQGYSNVVHGGLVSTVLDEAMVTLINHMGRLAVTGELRVRFLRPVPVGEPITVSAVLDERRGRIFRVSATAELPDGETAARAEATCVDMGPMPL